MATNNDSQPRYPKRKRTTVNYEIDLSVDGDLDLDDPGGNVSEALGEDQPSQATASATDQLSVPAYLQANEHDSEFEDATFGSRKIKKRRVVVKPKKPKKPPPFKPFRLMHLPPELRLKIYEEALVDPHGVNIRAYLDTSGLESVAVHVRPFANTSSYSWPPKCYIRGKWSDIPDLMKVRTRYKLSTNLLVASKTIHCEAVSLLWSQPFIFHSLHSLHCFLLMLRPQTISRLRDITILRKGWSSTRALPAFALLRDATMLQNLRLDCRVRSGVPFSAGVTRDVRAGHLLAERLYSDCYPFLRALVRHQGPESVRRVIKLSKLDFTNRGYDPTTQAWVHDDWSQNREDTILDAMTDELSAIMTRKIVPKLPRSHV